MRILKGNFGLRKNNSIDAPYPKWEIAAAVLLLYLSPFTSSLLAYVAFLICACRIVLYDARVFATDYALLIPMMQLLRAGDMSLLIYLCLIATIWYFITGELRKELTYAVLLILLNYFVLRMPWNIGGLVLCFGQLFMLCVLLSKQDAHSAERTVKMFCWSLLLSSFYALLLRNTSQLYELRGAEIPAYWGSALNRFQGLFQDPNYYMTLLITAMALLLKLLDCGRIKPIFFILFELCFGFFGVITYSKTFFLSLLLLMIIGIIWLFQNKKYILGTVFIVVGAVLMWMLLSNSSIFSTVLFRLSSSTSVSELTTGRSEVFADYYNAITKNVSSLLFGAGLAAENLGKDPHNLYLEIAYYIGVVGLLLVICFCVAILSVLSKKMADAPKQKLIAKYVVLFMALVLHFTLHGMFSIISYAVFFLAFLSVLITKQTQEA